MPTPLDPKIETAPRWENLEELNAWLEKKPNPDELFNALVRAVVERDLPAIKALLEAEADPNHDPNRPILYFAFYRGNDETARTIARYLVEHGAEIDWTVKGDFVYGTPPDLGPCNCMPELCGRDFPPPDRKIDFDPYLYEHAFLSPNCYRYREAARIVHKATGEVVFVLTMDVSGWITSDLVEATGAPPKELYVYAYSAGTSYGRALAFLWELNGERIRNLVAEEFGVQTHPLLDDIDGDGGDDLVMYGDYPFVFLPLALSVYVPEVYGYDQKADAFVHKAPKIRSVYRYLAARFRDKELNPYAEMDGNERLSAALNYWAYLYRAGEADKGEKRAIAFLRKNVPPEQAEYLLKRFREGKEDLKKRLDERARPLEKETQLPLILDLSHSR